MIVIVPEGVVEILYGQGGANPIPPLHDLADFEQSLLQAYDQLIERL